LNVVLGTIFNKQRRGMMKRGLNVCCYPEKKCLEECFSEAKAKGFEGIEINMEEGCENGLNLHINSSKD